MNKRQIIKHPLRTIRLAYHPSKEKHPLEEQAIAEYIAIHDEIQQLKNELRRQGNLQERMQQVQVGLQGRLLSLEQELEFHEVGLGLANPDILPPLTAPITLDPADLFDASRAFQQDFQQLYEGMVLCYEGHNAFIEKDEAFDEQFERFATGLFMEVMNNYERLSLDIVAFDRDYDDMKSVFTPYNFSKELFYARSEAFFNVYSGFVETVDTFFRRVEKVDDGTEKLLKRLRGR